MQFLRVRERIGGEQFKEWIVALALALLKRGEPLLELGICSFGLAHGARAREAIERQGKAKDGSGRECDEEWRCAPTATPCAGKAS